MNFTLNILGTASALPTVNRFPSAQVLEVRGRLFLIDAGEGVQIRMRRMRLSIMKIDDIFISHVHGDHIYGIFGLLSTMSMLGRTAKLHIYAPGDFKIYLDFVKATAGLKYEVEHHILDMSSPEVIYSTKSLEIISFPLRHGVKTFGFMFREKEPLFNVRKHCISRYELSLSEIASLKRGEDVYRTDGEVISVAEAAYKPYSPRSYAYCSDTAPFEDLSKWVKGVSLLYHEATFPSEMTEMAALTFHSTARQAAQCAADAGAGSLILGHFSSRYPDVSSFLSEALEIFSKVSLASDCMRVEIPLIKYI